VDRIIRRVLDASLMLVVLASGVTTVAALVFADRSGTDVTQRLGVRSRLPVPGQHSSADGLLLVWFSPTCSVCRAEAPVYRQLALSRTCGAVYFVSGEPASARQFLEEFNIPDGQLAAMPSITDAVPTVVSVSGSGIVRRVWVGRLAPDARDSLLAGRCD
jgi:hypothetical protein